MRDLAGSWAGRALRVMLLVSVAFPQSSVFALAVYDGVHGKSDSSAFVTTAGQANLKSISYDKSALRIHLDRSVPYRVFSLNRPLGWWWNCRERSTAPNPTRRRLTTGFLIGSEAPSLSLPLKW
ncbi:MAG: hypothetical protein IPN90_00060 [Elusimicrobia bacterium]|nr:hypothetical protein [Elusimicrobiota bacterium]